MQGKPACLVLLFLLLVSTMVLAFNVQPVKSDYTWTTTIFINADGSISPSGAPISSVDNVTYTLTDNITGAGARAISIQRNNTIIDGAGHTLQGINASNSEGIDLTGSNVAIKNMKIIAFTYGIFLDYSSGNTLSGNNIALNSPASNAVGILVAWSPNNTLSDNNVVNNVNGILIYDQSSSGNTLSGNNVTGNNGWGIWLGSNDNVLSGNNVTHNSDGIALDSCSNNILSGNYVALSNYLGIWLNFSSDNTVSGNNIANNGYGIYLDSSSNNTIYHNNFMNNTSQVYSSNSTNVWDDGYPSGGNYWSDYNGTDVHGGPYQNETGSDGIGDTPYVIDVNNRDNYPLMQPYSAHSTRYSWPMFRQAPGHTGYTESPAPNTNQLRWNYTTGGYVFSSSAVVDGKVYVGSSDGRVYCLDAATGTQVWNYTTGNWVVSSPAVVDGKVYVGSHDDRIYCLDAATGAQVWNYTTGGYVSSSPAVVDDKVYVGSYDDKVYCLDAATGAQVWNYTTGSTVYSSPAVVYGKVYVGSEDGRVYCFDAVSGVQVWNYTTGDVVDSSPAVVDSKVFVGSYDNRVYCLDAVSGRQVWNYTTGGWVGSSPAVVDGKVYVGSDDSRVYCLDAVSGRQVWNYTTGGAVSPSSPAVADGMVFVGSSDKRIYCLDAATGMQVWNYTTASVVYSSPAVADGMVYVSSEDSLLYAFGNVVRVPEDYKTIQAAINAATPGATIWIDPGVYHESLVINKTITLIGKPGSEPIFNGGGSGIAITIVSSGSGSTIAGITITSWDQGIIVQNANCCKIYDNIMSLINNNAIAFQGTSSVNNQVYSNIFQQDAVGRRRDLLLTEQHDFTEHLHAQHHGP